ncbi:MAG TPA: HAMP domain-containing sensor histidine kinase [Cyclobacteriaceae bacterium]
MKPLLQKINDLGTSVSYPRWKNRGIRITNNISIICAFFVLLLIVVHTLTYGIEDLIYRGSGIIICLLLIPFINKSSKIDIARTLLTLCLITGTMVLTVSNKLGTGEVVSMSTFYNSRVAILFFSILPFATIHFTERKLLLFNLVIGFFALLLFDPIHNASGVGFEQLGFLDPTYYYTNVIFMIVYLMVISSVAFFKKVIDNYEQENEILIHSLHTKTTVIESQKEKLESQGEILKQLLQEKDKDLSKVTEELIKFNHDLLQYSYTISHNLRGPVARTLGLLDLFKNADKESDKEMFIENILNSTQTLDGIIHDLNKIIETQSDSYNILEQVEFDDLLNQVISLLAIPIHTYHIKISRDFSVKEIVTVRSRLNHVLFTTISNAIQFRREETMTEVRISTYRKGGEVVLEIQDNGRGIDLDLAGEKIFKPFKRFHPDVSGKGIGLFLVKLQLERLQSRAEVKSTPGAGSTFIFSLKEWNNEVLVQ